MQRNGARIVNCEKLIDLFTKDRITGAGAETAKEKRKRWKSKIGDDYESSEVIDKPLSQNKNSLESFNLMDD